MIRRMNSLTAITFSAFDLQRKEKVNVINSNEKSKKNKNPITNLPLIVFVGREFYLMKKISLKKDSLEHQKKTIFP
ncbi:hypothetical protein AB4X15_11795 [Peribacillus simplex]|uniref:hypothetical protein n=1 Tax=Peribacillus TaxID=2675229 RepID=UPI0017804141|nr:hypothetical protein [Brevibacillus sp. JNUCC-41]QOS89392.1 hypothetical protein JNUCC41_22000 [Brevibacillus sp. JNUCC-41]